MKERSKIHLFNTVNAFMLGLVFSYYVFVDNILALIPLIIILIFLSIISFCIYLKINKKI